MALQLVTCCDGFIPSRLLGGAAMSWPPAPSRGRGIRGCSRQATCSSSSRRAPPRRFSNGCANGLCSSGNRSSWAASSNRLCGKRSNGGDDTSIGSSRVNGDSDGDGILSITTFNVLAPIFKRVGTGRESEFREAYLARHASIISHLKSVGSDVICLQELWVAEQEMVDMYQRSLQGYSMFTLPRTEARGDGVACFVKEDIDVLDKQDLRLKGVGGRVALVLRLGIGGGGEGGGGRREVVVANTHLLFPHARTFQILRIRELRKLLAFVECYTQTNDLAHLPVVLCGDFNGRTSGRVYQHLADRGFRCSYEDTLGPGADCSRWITHVNHLGEELGVDYIWYRNPDPRLEPMEPAWESIVYQSTKQQLLSAFPEAGASSTPSLKEQQQPSLEAAAVAAAAAAAGGEAELVADESGDIEKNRLSAACQLLGLSEGFELDAEELKLLLDSSGDDFDFLVPTILDGSSTGLEGASGGGTSSSLEACGSTLETISSRIWPPSLEQGVWPADYNISDHGSLTASFKVAPPTVMPPPKHGECQVGGGGGSTASVRVSATPASVSAGNEEDDDGHYGLR
eukprot:g16407.t1